MMKKSTIKETSDLEKSTIHCAESLVSENVSKDEPKYLTEAHRTQSEKAIEYILKSKKLNYTLEDALAQQKRNST